LSAIARFSFRLQLLEKFASRARDEYPAWDAALAIFDPLDDAGGLATFGAVGALGCVHFFLAVGGFGNFHGFLLIYCTHRPLNACWRISVGAVSGGSRLRICAEDAEWLQFPAEAILSQVAGVCLEKYR
jgi:hypothetical protein